MENMSESCVKWSFKYYFQEVQIGTYVAIN